MNKYTNFEKARNNRDRKSAYNQYSDFSREIPNLMKVTKKYKNSGNVCLGYAKNAGNWRPWRFGKQPFTIHPSTVIQIEGGNTYWLQTVNVCKYLEENRLKLRELESNKFKGLVTKSYIVKIEDLIEYDLQQSFELAA
jgi:hypothetical protein